MKSNFVEALIGAAVLLGAGFFVVYTYTHTDIGRGGGADYIAYFTRADGLAVGSDVRMSGVKVGSVSALRLSPEHNYRAEIRLSVDGSVPLYVDASAKIASEGLLGGNYISLDPGGGFDEVIPQGGEIVDTIPSVDLMGLLGQAIFRATEGDNKAGTDAPTP